MTITFNRETYENLLVEVLPQPILHGRGFANETEDEYQRALAIVELLMNKENTNPEEDRLLDLFVILVEKFESEHYPAQKRSTPHSRLLHLMDANHLQSVDLIDIFGSSEIAQAIVEGRKSIEPNEAQKLSDRFNVPLSIFLA
jgi:HTH-type transcriptional regulator / antitoxin HigA